MQNFQGGMIKLVQVWNRKTNCGWTPEGKTQCKIPELVETQSCGPYCLEQALRMGEAG